MNSVNLTGRLTKDPELKTRQDGGAYCFFCLAVDNGKDKDGNRLTEFIDSIAYNQPATFLSSYAHKGDLIELSGRVHTSIREDNEGRRDKRTTIIVNTLSILSKKEQKPEARADNSAGTLPFDI